MNKSEAKALIMEFEKKMPVSTMGLCYLLEKGSALVQDTTEEEYAEAIDKQIADIEDRNHVPILSRDIALELFRFAKRLAEVDPIDLIALLGHVYQAHYRELMDRSDT